jgi:hypothetical protein
MTPEAAKYLLFFYLLVTWIFSQRMLDGSGAAWMLMSSFRKVLLLFIGMFFFGLGQSFCARS